MLVYVEFHRVAPITVIDWFAITGIDTVYIFCDHAYHGSSLIDESPRYIVE